MDAKDQQLEERSELDGFDVQQMQDTIMSSANITSNTSFAALVNESFAERQTQIKMVPTEREHAKSEKLSQEESEIEFEQETQEAIDNTSKQNVQNQMSYLTRNNTSQANSTSKVKGNATRNSTGNLTAGVANNTHEEQNSTQTLTQMESERKHKSKMLKNKIRTEDKLQRDDDKLADAIRGRVKLTVANMAKNATANSTGNKTSNSTKANVTKTFAIKV